MQRTLAFFALAATVFLLAWVAFRGRVSDAVVPTGTSCEARCFSRDPVCAPLAATQGGFPSADRPEAERRAACNGLCYVLRAQAPGRVDACLER
ncbi:MAG: hypothetical protein EXR71_01140 [Myxococcales bacterium]|nr:hypothetical protein [Myxococcales bacterium]